MDRAARSTGCIVRIAFIGSGRLAQALARLALAAGHEIVLTNSRGPDHADRFDRNSGSSRVGGQCGHRSKGERLGSSRLPWGKTRDAVSVVPDWQGKIVIDATNNRSGPEIFDIGGVHPQMMTPAETRAKLDGARVK
jgi:8-hydroxy-5-deazaflavin:NADPH oxidoreductase